MLVTRATQITYSPCGHTRAVTKAVVEGLGLPVTVNNITKANTQAVSNIDMEEIAVIGSPVYEGRLPKVVVKRLNTLAGTFSCALLVLTYGMHTYGDAARELAELVGASGFTVAGLLVAPCEHAMFPGVGAGRPDADDLAAARAFGRDAAEKIRGAASPFDLPALAIPRRPFEEPATESGFKARCDSTLCVRCSICASLCPTGSIPYDNFTETRARTCTSCMACVKYCPVMARSLRPAGRLEAASALMAAVGANDARPVSVL